MGVIVTMPQLTPPTPLTGDHFDMIVAGQRANNAAIHLIGQMKEAGLDVAAHEAYAQATAQKLAGLQKTFFPNGRPKG